MKKLNIAIIGGGAAGFFAAIAAKEENPDAEVTIMEKAGKVLAKVAITGGGRCNLTNSFRDIADEKQAYPRGFRLIKRLFNQFDYHDAYQWFEHRGVKLTTQDDQCVFPLSQDAMSVVGCLQAEACRLGVRVLTGEKTENIAVAPDGRPALTMADGTVRLFDRVAVATGGMPRKGDFLGLRAMGHTIEQPIASLFTFNIADKALLSLMGTVANPVTTALVSTKIRARGPLLITHWGMSGPAILKLSSHGARYLHEHDYKAQVAVNWLNEAGRTAVADRLGEMVAAHPQKQLSTLCPFALPTRLWQYLLHKAGVPEERRWAELGAKGINRLVETLTNDVYAISGKGSFRDEFVTCGGVSLGDINFNTMQSKHCAALYFAGEVLDIDAITGGFNLQAAWTTGYVAGRHIAANE